MKDRIAGPLGDMVSDEALAGSRTGDRRDNARVNTRERQGFEVKHGNSWTGRNCDRHKEAFLNCILYSSRLAPFVRRKTPGPIIPEDD